MQFRRYARRATFSMLRSVSKFFFFTNKFAMAVVRFRADALDRLNQLWIDRLRGDQLRQASKSMPPHWAELITPLISAT